MRGGVFIHEEGDLNVDLASAAGTNIVGKGGEAGVGVDDLVTSEEGTGYRTEGDCGWGCVNTASSSREGGEG